MKNKIPKSKAKTAYGLLSEVRKLILEEPKRYNQCSYIDRLAEWSNPPPDVVKAYPACGTIGCVAGWVSTLKIRRHFDYGEAGPLAADLLGLRSDQYDELFGEHALDHTLASVGTKAYARAGAKHIAGFQKKYATQLKAKRV